MSKIFTSYFYQVRFFNRNLIPVSICSKDPEWFRGFNYYKLRPNQKSISVGEAAGNWGKEYAEAYKQFVLSQFNPHDIYSELLQFAKKENQHVIILGYEVPSDRYSERFIVSDWLNSAGYCIRELRYPIEKEDFI